MNKDKFHNVSFIIDDANYIRHPQMQKTLNKNSEKHNVELHRSNGMVFRKHSSRNYKIKNQFNEYMFYNDKDARETIYKYTKTIVKNKSNINKTVIIGKKYCAR